MFFNKIKTNFEAIVVLIMVIYAFGEVKGCSKEENYFVIETVKSFEPYEIRSSVWCAQIPPRCSKSQTEMRQIEKKMNVTKTRTICCEGYKEIKDYSLNITTCKPECMGGCVRGFCLSPNSCVCDDGFIGIHCNERCRRNKWGKNCSNDCKCQNNAICDNKTGFCGCPEGWMGQFCEIACPKGFYGISCKEKCKCKSKCNRFSGLCEINLFDMTTSNPFPTVVKGTAQRIEANEWIKVDPNKRTVSIRADLPNITSSISLKLNALNSSVQLLTENAHKLSKQLGNESEVELVPEHVDFQTTNRNDFSISYEQYEIENNLDHSEKEQLIWEEDFIPSNTTDFTKYFIGFIICVVIITGVLSIRICILINYIYKKRRFIAQSKVLSLPTQNQRKSFNKPLPDIPGSIKGQEFHSVCNDTYELDNQLELEQGYKRMTGIRIYVPSPAIAPSENIYDEIKYTSPVMPTPNIVENMPVYNN